MILSFYPCMIGELCIEQTNGFITHIYFMHEFPADVKTGETPLIKEAKLQLDEYFAGNRKLFSIPISPQGTPYAKKIWELLRAIPYGQTQTYKQIAEKAGNPGAARAVGLACNKNPIALLIPCHRVIGSNGALTGYRGGLDVKRALLELEGRRK